MNFKTLATIAVGIFLLAVFCTSGANGAPGKGGRGKGCRGKGGPRCRGRPGTITAPTWHVAAATKPEVEHWKSVAGNDYSADVAEATAKFSIDNFKKHYGKGTKGTSKGKHIIWDELKDRPGPDGNAHDLMPDGKATNKYFSFWYGASSGTQLDDAHVIGGGTGVRVVIEVDQHGNPTDKYWVAEHPPKDEKGNAPGYQNWSNPKQIGT